MIIDVIKNQNLKKYIYIYDLTYPPWIRPWEGGCIYENLNKIKLTLKYLTFFFHFQQLYSIGPPSPSQKSFLLILAHKRSLTAQKYLKIGKN